MIRKRKHRFDQARRRASSRYWVLTKRSLLPLLILVLGIILIYWIVFGKALSIQSVNCQQDDSFCDEQILAELGRFKGNSILSFEPDPLIDKLTKADPKIDSIKVAIEFPKSITVNIKTRKPIVALKTVKSNKAFLVDKEEMVFGLTQDESKLPPLVIIDDLTEIQIGKQITNQKIKSSIKLAILMGESFIGYSQLTLNQDAVEVTLTGGSTAIFSHRRDLKSQVTSLQQILSQATIDQRPVKIDLRYDKPVVNSEEME